MKGTCENCHKERVLRPFKIPDSKKGETLKLCGSCRKMLKRTW